MGFLGRCEKFKMTLISLCRRKWCVREILGFCFVSGVFEVRSLEVYEKKYFVSIPFKKINYDFILFFLFR